MEGSMVRTLVVVAVALAGLMPVVAAADDKSAALQLCAAQLSRTYGIAKATVAKFQVGGSGDKYSVRGYSDDNALVTCKVHKGRVTDITVG
jgi:hypothetical protein